MAVPVWPAALIGWHPAADTDRHRTRCFRGERSARRHRRPPAPARSRGSPAASRGPASRGRSRRRAEPQAPDRAAASPGARANSISTRSPGGGLLRGRDRAIEQGIERRARGVVAGGEDHGRRVGSPASAVPGLRTSTSATRTMRADRGDEILRDQQDEPSPPLAPRRRTAGLARCRRSSTGFPSPPAPSSPRSSTG